MSRFRRSRKAVPWLAEHAVSSRRMRHLLASRAVTDGDQARWESLQRQCADGGSRGRLARLIHRLGSRDRGVQESALAELELATLLIRSGVSLRFLPESQARSADFECHIGEERFFVEVTAMVGAAERSKAFSLRPMVPHGDGEQPDTPGHLLVNAILARVRQKAKQLADYCDPVLLAISVPRLDDRTAVLRSHDPVRLDVKQLVGWLSLLLPGLPHLSGVLLALWDVEPLPFTSNVRLGNVSLVERSRHQQAYPRVRILVLNPAAENPLRAGGRGAIRELL
ncbi:MAG TPA: hypothetical protein VJ805_07250 [Nitrospiraceae bacterium]|nr:hypothetical protein [Nitrospiraceae bacterium]